MAHSTTWGIDYGTRLEVYGEAQSLEVEEATETLLKVSDTHCLQQELLSFLFEEL